MKVTEISLLNFRNIKNFKASFDGGVYLITGDNEVGKSTLLNALATILTGERTDNNLMQGEEAGQVNATIGNDDLKYNVEFKFTKKNPRGTLTITQEGMAMKSDKVTALQSIFGYQDFDAHEFLLWSETAEGRRKQIKLVKSLFGKEGLLQYDKLTQDILDAKNKRGVTEARKLSNDNLLLNLPDPGEIKEPEKTQEQIKEEIRKARENNENIQKGEAYLKDLMGKILGLDSESVRRIKKHEEKIIELEQAVINAYKELEETKKEIKEEREQMAGLKLKAETKLQSMTVIPVEPLEDELEYLYNITSQLKDKKRREVILIEVGKDKEEVDKYQTLISEYERERKEILNAQNLPISGLSFDEEGLTLNNLPFRLDTVSTSQQMEIAARLVIAKNPVTKVFRIAQGESLGAERLKSIVKFAEENGYQGFIEEVHRGQVDLVVEKYTEE